MKTSAAVLFAVILTALATRLIFVGPMEQKHRAELAALGRAKDLAVYEAVFGFKPDRSSNREEQALAGILKEQEREQADFTKVINNNGDWRGALESSETIARRYQIAVEISNKLAKDQASSYK